MVNHITFKPFRGKSIELKFNKFKKNYRTLLTKAFDAANNKQIPITVTMTSEYICFSFDETLLNADSYTPIKNRYAGIDLNPNYVGVSIFDVDGRTIHTKLYSSKELTTKNGSDSKLEYETFEVGNDIVKMLKHFGVDYVFVEDLSKIHKAKKVVSKAFNRLCNNKWKREKLLRPIKKFFGKKCISINAAYTSTIGNILNPNLPDPIAASTAIANRGFEIVIVKSKKFYPELPERRT